MGRTAVVMVEVMLVMTVVGAMSVVALIVNTVIGSEVVVMSEDAVFVVRIRGCWHKWC